MNVRGCVVLALFGALAMGGPGVHANGVRNAFQSSNTSLGSVKLGRLVAWATAVDQHDPGVDDEWARQVGGWPFEDVNHIVVKLLPGIVLGMMFQSLPGSFQVDLRIPVVTDSVPREFARSDRDVVQRVINLALTRGDANRFLKRAALLHTDVAMLGRDEEPISSQPNSPTYIQRFADGRQTASGRGHTHWQAAREILDLVPDRDSTRPRTLVVRPEGDADVRAWYIAATSYMASRDRYSAQHLETALYLFPEDSELLMLAGAAHARLATPELQRVVRGTELTRGLDPAVGSAREELRRAESLLRRSLAANPTHTEARIRLGRVLSLRDDTKQAIAELQSAAAATDEPLLRYFAHLCIGDVAEMSGNSDLARASYQRARDLYPDAQAPLLALSHLALRTEGHQAAAKQLALLKDVSIDEFADPWWHFHTSAGRNAAALMQRWYEAVQ